jgi:hypothetical protein
MSVRLSTRVDHLCLGHIFAAESKIIFDGGVEQNGLLLYNSN